jgi:hypothetical protein
MGFHIDFRNKRIKQLRVNIFPWAKFPDIFNFFEEITFYPEVFSRDNTMYAVLELVNNSLRAMRETNAAEPIGVHFLAKDACLNIDIKDSGGGFDPSRLPYDLDQSAESLDLNGDKFLEYRSTHNNTRFGMGLYIAKRSFHEFQLCFINKNGESRPWGSTDIIGTHIRLSLKAGVPD